MPLGLAAQAAIAGGFELGKLLIQAYYLAAKQAGLTEEQAKANMIVTYDKFMVASAQPVEDVKP